MEEKAFKTYTGANRIPIIPVLERSDTAASNAVCFAFRSGGSFVCRAVGLAGATCGFGKGVTRAIFRTGMWISEKEVERKKGRGYVERGGEVGWRALGPMLSEDMRRGCNYMFNAVEKPTRARRRSPEVEKRIFTEIYIRGGGFVDGEAI